MRHGKKFNTLSRKTGHRKSMLANMSCSLIEHKRINTTTAKAKALRKYVEPLITKSKTDTTHNRRLTFAKLRNKYAVTELFREVAPKIGDRPGGYTRIIKLGNRLGDNAPMAMIELVDFNETYDLSSGGKEKKTRRSRRGGSKSTAKKQEDDHVSDSKKETAKSDAPPVEEVSKAENKATPEKENAPEAESKPETKKEAPAKAKKEEKDGADKAKKDDKTDGKE